MTRSLGSQSITFTVHQKSGWFAKVSIARWMFFKNKGRNFKEMGCIIRWCDHQQVGKVMAPQPWRLISWMYITTFLKESSLKTPQDLDMNQLWSSWRFFKDFGEKIQQPIFRSIQFSHILAVQVGTEVDDRVYFSPLRGNAWKLRSWNGTSWEAMAMSFVLFWFTRKRCLKSSNIWNILTSAPWKHKHFSKSFGNSSIVMSPEVLFSSAQFRTLAI